MPARILIADDHEDNRELISFLLRDSGYDVHEVGDGHECLQVAREQRPDLIMVDLSMPRLDGWKVLQELKNDGRTSNIPCVAVTAHAEFNQHRALQVGFDAYLSKPFRIEALLELVKEVLSAPQAKANVVEAGIAESATDSHR